ncbi:ABC transporter ATP-binding protein [Streptomyces sp. CB02923]|uniref:ABC transporter ATP-binding protein n=1 Tax=Streptomyces sp. CB02923 TaxID=1718985 RepID=UPI0009A10174|nr:ABC transporter ATP-binding protein [Streptomyces sp. CB02923]
MKWPRLHAPKAQSADDTDMGVTESERLLFGGRLRLDLAWLRHEDALLDLTLRGMVVRLPHLLALTARLARQANARALRQVLGAEVGRGAVQAASMIAINHVLAALLSPGPTTQRLSAALPALVAVAVCSVIGAGLHAVSTAGTGRLEPAVERVATEIYLTAAAKVEMAAFEDPDYHRRAESARFGASSARRMIQYSTSVIHALMSLLASIGVLTVLHPALLPMIVMMTLPSAWATLVIARRRYTSFKVWTQHARAGRLISELLTSTHAAAEIRLHGIAAFLLHHFRSMSETAEEEQARLARLAARTGILASVLTGIAYAATFSILGLLLWTGAMPLAVGGTAIIAIRTATSSLSGLVHQINYLNEESLFVGDLEHIQDEAGRRAIPATGRPVPEHVDGVRFEKVSFTYPGKDNKPALDGVDLHIPAGATVALVGENGSGKTTAAKLLAGLYLPDEGQVLVAGVPTSEIDRHAWFSRIANVSQDFYHWPLTARMNVAIGRTDADPTEERLTAGARHADSEDLIEDLPRGWGTLLARGYQDGHSLSGGQWQKLGIARAHFRAGQLLVVDEPTAALDAKAEQRTFANIRALAAGGQTVVLITHRLHSVRSADLIYLMEDGRVAESGTFTELMNPATAPDGRFRIMYGVQRAQFVTDDDEQPWPLQKGPTVT